MQKLRKNLLKLIICTFDTVFCILSIISTTLLHRQHIHSKFASIILYMYMLTIYFLSKREAVNMQGTVYLLLLDYQEIVLHPMPEDVDELSALVGI